MSENNKDKIVVGTQIPKEVYDKLVDYAEADFMSLSAYVRKILLLHIKSLDEKYKEGK